MRQHLIPNCYLKAWCDPRTPEGQTPYIWRIARDGSGKKNRAPEKSFTATDRYTIKLPTGEKDLIVENTLAGLENAFVSVRSKIERQHELTNEERATLCLFTAAMHSRTRRAGDHWQQTAQQMHEIVSSMEEQHNLEPTTSRQTGRLVEIAPQHLVMTMLEVQAPMYFAMELSVFVANDELGFITSDSPCVWFNPTLHTLPPFYRSPGLGQSDIEVTLPLTPQHLLFISHRKHPFYMPVGQNVVDEANRLSRAHSDIEFVSWKGETRPYWFETGTMPDDAWENTDPGRKAMRESAEWEQQLNEWKKGTKEKED
ncbi:MAG TPA: DUF4238 domain-containing protein [Candidatus Sulfotelmatobacter sp.]|nr:DUF4238 domain-containing protein [Candidatus Sulfotelmatobacter sp.]